MNVNSDNRTIAFLLILGFIAFAAFAVWETCKSRKRVFGKIRKTYGQWPEREYSMEEFDAISHYYVHRKKEGLPVIDDITWNDLDMDRIFMLLNHTWSCIGESYLYCLLRMPAMEEESLKGAQPPHRVFPDTPGGTGKGWSTALPESERPEVSPCLIISTIWRS